jgi:hypothetical protein
MVGFRDAVRDVNKCCPFQRDYFPRSLSNQLLHKPRWQVHYFVLRWRKFWQYIVVGSSSCHYHNHWLSCDSKRNSCSVRHATKRCAWPTLTLSLFRLLWSQLVPLYCFQVFWQSLRASLGASIGAGQAIQTYHCLFRTLKRGFDVQGCASSVYLYQCSSKGCLLCTWLPFYYGGRPADFPLDRSWFWYRSVIWLVRSLEKPEIWCY